MHVTKKKLWKVEMNSCVNTSSQGVLPGSGGLNAASTRFVACLYFDVITV